MSTEAWILLIVLIVALLGTVGVKLYKAKKNDGVITKDEVAEIVDTFRSGICNIITKMMEVSEKQKVGPDAEREYVKKQLTEQVLNNTVIKENEKQLIVNNMDSIIDFIIKNKDKILQDEKNDNKPVGGVKPSEE